MKKTMRLSSIFLFSTFVLIFASSAFGQRVGGYKQVATNDPMAQAAAEFAVSAEAKKSGKEIELISVQKAERQTVQGANYRLCLNVNAEGEDGEADASIFVQAVVYLDLKRNYRLISWATSDCGDED